MPQGGLHASVTQAAASLPGSPARAAPGSRPALPDAPRAAHPLTDSAHDALLSSGASKAWAQALYDECASPLQQQQRASKAAASPSKGEVPCLIDSIQCTRGLLFG